MVKRFFDFIISFIGLIFLSPIFLIIIFLIWMQDFKSPFYISNRVGINGDLFKMLKLRSMVVNADKSGVDSTSSNDLRITNIGKFIRKYKLDELSQLCNVFYGNMSLVGPRPNVKRETDLYSNQEKVLLTVKPGITDFSSIVFSDEGEILNFSKNPDLDYNQLIRPWKGYLGLIYVSNNNLFIDIKLILYTLISIYSKKIALKCIINELKKLNADDELISVCKRENPLVPTPPPGFNNVVVSR